jgi:excisionase family DNA binding protein
MLTLAELCDWLNITERHARKLVERGAIPYHKVGHLLRFAAAEVEEWSRPAPRSPRPPARAIPEIPHQHRRTGRTVLPKSLIE